MARDKRKTLGSVGTVLRKIPNADVLKQWVDFICSQDPWQAAGVSAEKMLEIFKNPDAKWQFFVAANPKDAKTTGFDYEDGFIAFVSESNPYIEQTVLKNAATLSGAALIFMNYGKPNHKTVAKYLLSAAERIISEKTKNVFVLSPKEDTLTARVYKPSLYEERSTLQGVLGANDHYQLLSKILE